MSLIQIMSSIGSTDLVLTEEMKTHHRDHYYQLLNEKLDKKDHTAMPMKEELHKRKLTFLLELEAGKNSIPPVTKSQLVKKYPQAYDWDRKYALIAIGTSQVLVYSNVKSVGMGRL